MSSAIYSIKYKLRNAAGLKVATPGMLSVSSLGRQGFILLKFVAFSAILFSFKLWLISSFGNATPFWDQWDAEAVNLYKPFLEGTLSWKDLLAPHNEHRIFTTRLIALGLLAANGIWNPLLQMVVNAGLHIAAILTAITCLSNVIGRQYLGALFVFSLFVFGIPFGWENTLAGFQSNFYLVLLFSLGSMWYTITKEPFSKGWWFGVILSLLAFLSLASGMFAAATAAIVLFLMYLLGKRKQRKLLMATAILVLLSIIFFLLTPSLNGPGSPKANSVSEFYSAFVQMLGWPVSENIFAAAIRNLPAFLFVGITFLTPPPIKDRKWYLLAAVIWMFMQIVSLAYGRAALSLSSRYQDFFTISILINFCCLISLGQMFLRQKRNWVAGSIFLWVAIVLFSLGTFSVKHVPIELVNKRDNGLLQEQNTRNYLITGNIDYLKDKPFLHIPYPDAPSLASMLAIPEIREILPSNIRLPLLHESVEIQPANAFVNKGYYPTTPFLSDSVWGSYGLQGNEATGQLTIRYKNIAHYKNIAIPIAGFPLNEGMKVELEQNNVRKIVDVKSNPHEAWDFLQLKIEEGPFAIHVSDPTKNFWISVGSPLTEGNYDRLAFSLLSNAHLFFIAGIAIIILLCLSGAKGVFANVSSID